LTFIRDPGLLKCWFCPCGDKVRNCCPGAGDGSCAETFFKFLFAEDKPDYVTNPLIEPIEEAQDA